MNPYKTIFFPCVVDPVARKFYLYSEQGDERVVDCETVDQFMSVLELVRDKCGDDVLAYTVLSEGKTTLNPKWRKKNSAKKSPYYLFQMGIHPLSKRDAKCYEYETRNPTIYGNVIRGEMEFAQSSEECRSDQQGDEDHV